MTPLALFVTNSGDPDGWLIVILVCVGAPVVAGLYLRWRDRRRP
jgi:hypothetical protein